MQTAAEFISDFIRDPLKRLDSEDDLRNSLKGVINLNRDSLREEVVRKLIAALRKKKCKVETPRNKDPFAVLAKWLTASAATVDPSSGPVNNSPQELNQNPSPPKGGKRKSGRKRRASSSASEEETTSVNNGSGPSNSNSASNGETAHSPTTSNHPNPNPQASGDGIGAAAVNGGLEHPFPLPLPRRA